MTAISGKPTFGVGRFFGTLIGTNPTPARALIPQSQSIDFKRKVESLFGEKQLAAAVGAGTMEVTGKVEYGKSVARILGDIMLGDAGVTGSYLEADGEAQNVPGSTSYVITVTNATAFVADLGVVATATGVIYACVASGAEVAGTSYSVSTTGGGKGVYKFNSGDAGLAMKISYLYSQTGGEQIVMSNQLQGSTGAFQAVHVLPWGSEQDTFVMNSCIASAFSAFAAKQSGFGFSSLEYTAGVDASGSLGTATFAEVS